MTVCLFFGHRQGRGILNKSAGQSDQETAWVLDMGKLGLDPRSVTCHPRVCDRPVSLSELLLSHV